MEEVHVQQKSTSPTVICYAYLSKSSLSQNKKYVFHQINLFVNSHHLYHIYTTPKNSSNPAQTKTQPKRRDAIYKISTPTAVDGKPRLIDLLLIWFPFCSHRKLSQKVDGLGPRSIKGWESTAGMFTGYVHTIN